MAGYLEWKAHEGAISDHFVGANEFSDHGRPGTRVELMVDSGSTATVCGLEHFSDTPVTIGPPMRLRASNGQPLKHYGQKKVELLSDSGEKMHVTFSVHDVKRAIISTSATAPSGIETHLDEWDSQKGRTVSYFKKRTSGGTRWLNMMTRGGLYFLGATVASGQLQQPGAYPMSCGYEYNLTFPTWRTIGDVAPVDGEQDRVTFPTWRTSGDVAPVDGDEEKAPAEEAAGAAPVDVAADADPANDQDDPEADGWSNDNVSLAPTDPKGPPISVGCAQSIEPTVVETIAQGWCESCVRGRGGCVRGRSRDDPHRRQDLEEGNPMPIVQCDYFFFKAEKEDILRKAIGAIDSVYNRTMALECEFKGLSDQAVPKQLREYLKSLGFKRAQVQGDPEGALNNVLDRAIHGLPGWTRRQSPLKDKPAHGRVERLHATLEGLMRTWRSSSSSAAVPGGAASSAAVPGGAASSTTSPGETVLQSPVTVEVAPMTGVQPETPGEAETGEPPYKAARSGDIVMVIDGETLCVPEEDVPKVYYEEDDGQVLPTEQVHEGMQRELQLMRDLEVSERVLRSDVSPGKKVWSTKWCHRRKGTGVRSRFVVRQFRDTDWETAFSGVPGLVVVRILLCASIILETSVVPGDLVAFMSTPLHDAEYIEPPLEAESDKQYVWKSRKALNGLKKADLRTAIHVDDPLTVGEIDTVMRFYDSLKQWLLVRVQDVVGFDEKQHLLGLQILASGTLFRGSCNRTLLRGCNCTSWHDQLQVCCDTWSQ